MGRRDSFDDRIRKAIRATGKSLYRVAKDIDMDVAPLQRFMSGKSTVRLTTAEKLCKLVAASRTASCRCSSFGLHVTTQLIETSRLRIFIDATRC